MESHSTQTTALHTRLQKYAKQSLAILQESESCNDNLYLIDYRVQGKGQQEDQLYLDKPFLLDDIRRGNTIVRKVQEDGGDDDMYVGRKGMIKFFKLSWEHLGEGGRDNAERRAIFGEVEKVLGR